EAHARGRAAELGDVASSVERARADGDLVTGDADERERLVARAAPQLLALLVIGEHSQSIAGGRQARPGRVDSDRVCPGRQGGRGGGRGRVGRGGARPRGTGRGTARGRAPPPGPPATFGPVLDGHTHARMSSVPPATSVNV